MLQVEASCQTEEALSHVEHESDSKENTPRNALVCVPASQQTSNSASKSLLQLDSLKLQEGIRSPIGQGNTINMECSSLACLTPQAKENHSSLVLRPHWISARQSNNIMHSQQADAANNPEKNRDNLSEVESENTNLCVDRLPSNCADCPTLQMQEDNEDPVRRPILLLQHPDSIFHAHMISSQED